MTTTLTERYIAAVTKSLDPTAQHDVRIELEASVADAVEARIEQGEVHEHAERAVLTELGDPAILAAGYADRPLHLIGPRYYLTWLRLLKLLLWIIPLTSVVGVTIANVLADAPVGTIIGQVISVGISVIVHVAFWTTLVFFALERTGADTGMRWSVDSLPEPQESGAGRGDLIASLVFLGLAAGAILWDRFIGFVRVADGTVDIASGLGAQTSPMPVLHPELWPWWIAGALVLIGAEAAVAIGVYARRSWNASLAAANTVLAVVFSAATVYLLTTDRLLNPEFIQFTTGRGDMPADVGLILAALLGAGVIGVAVWDITDGWRKARRSIR